MSQAFDYIKDNGICLESEYKYEGRAGRCRKKGFSYKIRECVNVTSGDNDELLEALAWNPVSVAISANNMQWMYYRKGIIEKGCNGELDHGVLLVGAGFDNQIPFWIVKNSWGTSWGQSGFARIKRDTGKGRGVCGIALEASYPLPLLTSE